MFCPSVPRGCGAFTAYLIDGTRVASVIRVTRSNREETATNPSSTSVSRARTEIALVQRIGAFCLRERNLAVPPALRAPARPPGREKWRGADDARGHCSATLGADDRSF
ncbi:hypothetical protein MSEN_29800 [Mycolicibacter senuensis]|uniref:Uncharacterized protein n=1 Tax=Mycolicibacter senuensis TaxID=386913 RepID=A0A7I9XNX0_9MYCO|nr:hypothetical protein MSEN_29800 [Mycolicibacter senuensis]